MRCPSCGADGAVASGRFCGSCGARLTPPSGPGPAEPEARPEREPRRGGRPSTAALGTIAAVVALVVGAVAAEQAAPAADVTVGGERTEVEASGARELPSVPMPGVTGPAPVHLDREPKLLCVPELAEAPEEIVRQMMKAGAAARVDGDVCLVVPRPRTAVPQADCVQMLRWSCVVP